MPLQRSVAADGVDAPENQEEYLRSIRRLEREMSDESASRSGEADATGDVWGAPPPAPYGDSSALQAVGEIAAPLLTGFTIALIGVVAQSPSSLRWPGAVLLGLVIAFVLLLTAVQSAFFARQRMWTQVDLRAWYTSEQLPADLESAFVLSHKADLAKWGWWREATRLTYNTGLVVLTVTVGLIVAPPVDDPLFLRWVALGVAFGAALGELAWWLWPRTPWSSHGGSK